jgi:SAM-dependent methyltransferase
VVEVTNSIRVHDEGDAPAALAPVRDWWDANVCGSQNTDEARYTREYFAEIERHRYGQEPFIHSFAQFTCHRGERVLEVGVGAATDFTQWVRAGALATGVDLTPAANPPARRRLALEGLEADDLRVGNAEALPFADDTFDVVYSWGVIHHSQSIENALREIVRVTRPGGVCKLMLYHRRSLCAAYVWLKWALLRGRPWRSISWCLANHVESPGTKAVTRGEVRGMLRRAGVGAARVDAVLTYHDRLDGHPVVRPLGHFLSRVAGDQRGWFLLIEFEKPDGASGAGRTT